jgi:hypothetical protein
MSQSNHNLGLVPSIITIKWADLLLLRNRMLFRKIVEIVNVQSREFPQIDPISKLRLFLLQEIPLHAAHISWTRPSITKWCPLPTQNKPEPLDPTWPFGPTLLSLIFVRWLYKFHFICFYETGFMIRFTINRSRYVVLIDSKSKSTDSGSPILTRSSCILDPRDIFVSSWLLLEVTRILTISFLQSFKSFTFIKEFRLSRMESYTLTSSLPVPIWIIMWSVGFKWNRQNHMIQYVELLFAYETVD